MKPVLTLLLALLVSTPALADDNSQPQYDHISLSAEASENVDNDTIVADLYTQQEGNDPARLSQQVNETIQWAINQARRHPEIQVKTQSYTTQPIYEKSRLSGWRVRQSIQLKSTNSPLLSELVGDLQAKLAVQSINYQVSDARRLKAEDLLISEALRAFTRRAELVLTTMGRKSYKIVDLQISTRGTPPPNPVYRMAAMAEASHAPPAILSGTQKLTVNVSGKIQLFGGDTQLSGD